MPLGQLGQASALCEAEVVEVEVVAGDDDGDGVALRVEVPTVEVDVDVGVGHGLEEHLRRQADTCLLHAQAGRYVEQRGREGSHAACEGLAPQVLDGGRAEGVASPRQVAQRADLAGGDKVVFLQEAVALRKDGRHVAIELDAKQHDAHAEEAGQEEARQLGAADVAAEKFPNESVHSFSTQL